MSNFSALLSNASGYAQAFRAMDITSLEMRQAIPQWFELYFQEKASKKEDPCQRIAYTVVRKLTKTVFSEYDATSNDKFAKVVLDALAQMGAEAMQMALIGGESLLKPIMFHGDLRFTVIPRYNVLVFGRDAAGRMTDIGTVEKTAHDKCYYTLLERRTVNETGHLTIRNKLFKSYTKESLGQEVPLTSLEQYAQLQEEYTFSKPIGTVGLISVRTPIANCVDGSADPVSVYAAAVGLIHNINRNEAQLNGEFDRGESRIIVSSDMLERDKDGNQKLDANLFVGLDEEQEATGITIFSPALREASFLARKQEYLRNVENVIGLKRGLLSEVEAAERTATEITSSAGEYNLTIIDFQRSWETTVKEAMRVCSILGQLYKLPGAHDIADDAVVITWGNGVLYDEAKTSSELLGLVNAGLLQPERYLGWYYNMPCETPEERAKIRALYMPDALEEGAE